MVSPACACGVDVDVDLGELAQLDEHVGARELGVGVVDDDLYVPGGRLEMLYCPVSSVMVAWVPCRAGPDATTVAPMTASPLA